MKVFMIGATGYIGRSVSSRLAEDGHSIVGLARTPETEAQLRAEGIEPLAGSLADLDAIRAGAEGADAIIQIASGGFLLGALDAANEALRANEVLLEVVREGDKKMIYTSGTGLWGDTGIMDPERVVTEVDPPAPPYFYAHLFEIYRSLMAAAEEGQRVIVIVPAQVYGEAGGPIGPVTRRFESARRFGKVYAVEPGTNAFTLVHVADLADLYALALSSESASGSYIAGVETRTIMEIAKGVSEAAGFGGEVATVSGTELRELIDPAAVLDFAWNMKASGQKAISELGWAPHRPGVLEALAALPQPLDLTTVYPGPRLPQSR